MTHLCKDHIQNRVHLESSNERKMKTARNPEMNVIFYPFMPVGPKSGLIVLILMKFCRQRLSWGEIGGGKLFIRLPTTLQVFCKIILNSTIIKKINLDDNF